MNNTKTLKADFVSETLKKIETLINLVLEYHSVNMKYDINKRNELFCEIIKKTKTELITSDMFKKIQDTMFTMETLETEQNKWLTDQIYKYNNDIFLLHYFYAILYSYNYDVQIREKVNAKHIEGFFLKANEMFVKYKNLKENEIKIQEEK